jgi:hypothetical protein
MAEKIIRYFSNRYLENVKSTKTSFVVSLNVCRAFQFGFMIRTRANALIYEY